MPNRTTNLHQMRVNTHFYIGFSIIWLVCSACGVKKSLAARPDTTGIQSIDTTRVQHSLTQYSLNKNSLQQNEQGIWELYVTGSPLERGLSAGNLTRELIQTQEDAFVGKIKEFIPSQGYLKLISKIVAWYNRKLHLHVPEEYKQEIYALSRYAPDTYNDVAMPYVRMLYAHGAHDIGHALQDLMLVGCTSFAAWGDKTADGKLLIGRNFDFYAGDDFAKQKVVTFMKPDSGYPFMSYGWAGMIGVVSGMNLQGLTVTINAGKSKIPLQAKTPISIVAREILQYASTIEEAIAIAQKREVFVSESIMIGSAIDRKVVLIEVAPSNFGVYEVANSNQLICANHFQSNAYAQDTRNQQAIAESHSLYRYQRMQELLAASEKLTPTHAAAILRNREGLENAAIGYGNEKALNQLLAHHGIIFQPQDRKVWVSTAPYQLGTFVAYDLKQVFEQMNSNSGTSLAVTSLNIPEDPFVHTDTYHNYERFRALSKTIEQATAAKKTIPAQQLVAYEQLNADYWRTYQILGAYHYAHKAYKKALIAYKQASRREITTVQDAAHIRKYIKKATRRLR